MTNKIISFLFHTDSSGCDAHNEGHNEAHPSRFGDRIIFVNFCRVGPEQERFPFDLPAK